MAAVPFSASLDLHLRPTITTPKYRPSFGCFKQGLLLPGCRCYFHYHGASSRRFPFRICAVKLPEGVVLPKVEPKLKPPVIGFTRTAEIWNSRACMIGLVGTFIVELILNKGILQVIGVDVGKGLNLPL